MITTALVYDHRGRVDNAHEGPIEVRVTIDRKVRYVSTGIRVLKKNWQHGVVVDRYDCAELNERLMLIMRRVEGEINRAIKEGNDLDLSTIRTNLLTWNNKTKSNSFISFGQESISLMPNSAERKEHYYTLLSRLTEYKQITDFEDLTVENIYRFNEWLHTLRKSDSRPLEQSTIYNYHKNLKALINFAVKLGKIEYNPYDRLKGEFGRGERESIEYLTEEEMKRIENLYLLPGELATARDLFVLQMYTGLSYSDAESLDLNEFKKVRGKWLYNGERVKTGVPYVSQLLSPVVAVLERHGWSVPQMAMQHYNENLKLIGKAAGIATRMHSHLARHTFATFMLRNGVKPENLQRMLGHTKITQSLHYAKVLATSVHEDYDKIEQLIAKKDDSSH